jgi:Ca2+-binding EF-hand superfamily protein
MALSTLLRGSREEKLAWIFYLYDVDSDGYISMDDMLHVVEAIYEMAGNNVDPPIKPCEIRQHAVNIFKVTEAGYDLGM